MHTSHATFDFIVNCEVYDNRELKIKVNAFCQPRISATLDLLENGFALFSLMKRKLLEF